MNHEEEARFAGSLILDNKIILYPTDTIWGIGANIHHSESLQKIAKIKSRSIHKTFILLVDSIEMLNQYVVRIHPRIETMLYYHVQPVTIIYPRVRNLPDYLLAEDKSIAIRVCKDLFCQNLISFIGKPLISTSANFSEQPSPGNFTEIDPLLIQQMDYVVKFRQKEIKKSQPSVIARYNEEGELEFIR